MTTLHHISIAALALMPLLGTAPPCNAAPPPGDIAPDTTFPERMRWFADAKSGMFIHWGLYSIPAGVHWNNPADKGHAEWYVETTKMPMSEYEKFADQFNPLKFDAEKWAQIAQDAGMKYLCITSMHHDGFAMFPSKVSDRDNWSLSRTPFGKAGRDPLMELKKACEKRGIKFCLYHTIMDWHSPLYGARRPTNDVANNSGIQPDTNKFQEYLEASVLEEIERYHPAMLWFDGNWEGCWTLENGKHLEAAIRKADPLVIINNRVGKGNHAKLDKNMLGDYLTPEQQIPAQGFGKGVAFEACMTMSGHNYWGINKADFDAKSVKSQQTLMNFLFDLSAKGGNMLLNVGPTAEGEIPDFCVPNLKGMGDWLKVNGQAIYGSRAGIYSRQPAWGRTTTKRLQNGNTRVYAILFEAPNDGVLNLEGLTNTPVKATLLDGGAPLAAQSKDGGVLVTLPATLAGKKNFVVAVDVAGEVAAEVALDLTPKADKDGVFALRPRHAATENGMALQGEGDAENLGFWTSKAGTATWTFTTPAARSYKLEVACGAENASDGSVIEFVSGNQVLPLTIKATGGWEKMTTLQAGTLKLPAGENKIVARAKTVNGIAPCNLGTLRLVPVK
ncbi:MAG: alpha-L-fucosidase [Verrucomicrobiota bacterium]